MFTEACAKAMQYTKPMVISKVLMDGTVDSGFATYFFINRDGWALTAAHCLQCTIQQHHDDELRQQVDAYNAQNPDDKKAYDPKWLKTHIIWWGNEAGRVETMKIEPFFDIALIKFAGLPSNFAGDFPVFKDPSTVRPGMSVCRLGYPFMKVKAEFIPESSRFNIEINNNTAPGGFPYEGMVTRQIIKKRTDANGRPLNNNPNDPISMYIECSTPGLIGQSGGPIFDRNGFVVGMQSHTNNMPLGFGDKQVDGKYMPEQFINVGVGVHVSTLIQMFKQNNIKYKSESDDDGYRIIG